MKSHDLKGIQFHNQRERESKTNPDIEHERTIENYDLVNENPIDYNKKVKGIIEGQKTGSRKTRKDAVLINELLVTSDRNFFDELDKEQTKKFFEDSLAIFEERYGEQNIAYATVHMDEKTPHMHVGIVPMRDGKLQGKNVFNRQELLWLQDKFPLKMKQLGFDLERGQKNSDREHLTVVDFKRQTVKENLEKDIESLTEQTTVRKNELLVLNKEISNEIKVPTKREYKQVEIESEEKNIFGIRKKEIVKKATGNVIIPEKEFKKLMTAAKDNKELKGRMELVFSTDLLKVNQELGMELRSANNELKLKEKEIRRLREENSDLKAHNRDLRDEIGFLYESTKEFLKERTESIKAFKGLFKSFVDKLREKVTGSDFERLHKREQARERNRDMER